MPLEPLANEAIQVHSILYALARNNAIIKLTIGLFTFVACTDIQWLRGCD